MNDRKIKMREAIKFHGHLGPYLVLGILAGDLAIKKLKGRKYFGLVVKVWGATQKPKSCLVDGLQLSTGATYGKGNIKKMNTDGNKIRILVKSSQGNKKIIITLKEDVIQKLAALKDHRNSEQFARGLNKSEPLKIFNLKTEN